MKLLVIGGTGLAGRYIRKRAKERDIEVESTYYSNKEEGLHKLDIRDQGSVEDLIAELNPSKVINAAAVSDVDWCEENRKKAWELNVKGTENIAGACEKTGTGIVHLSTEHVYPGKKGHYKEKDSTGPVNFYGKTKLASEYTVEKFETDTAIIRSTIIYGLNPYRDNFILWLLENLREEENLRIVKDQHSNPIYAPDLAEALIKVSKENLTGRFNVGGSKCFSRYEFALTAAEIFEHDKSLINSTTTDQLGLEAERPVQNCLSTEKIREEGVELRSPENGLRHMKRFMQMY